MRKVLFEVTNVVKGKATLKTVTKSSSLIVVKSRCALSNFKTLKVGENFKVSFEAVK